MHPINISLRITTFSQLINRYVRLRMEERGTVTTVAEAAKQQERKLL